ncbi:MAG: DHA2 family efflux MFS transporter permease subunit [Peptococcaceae bacterium]|nr:DHA2 family efflux MFS transporter permease subunit [Peptococcaceae bacterium]
MVLVLGAFMAILDGSIINVALPRLMAIFNVNPSKIQWIMTAYLLTSGVVVPITGYLGDRFGYKRIYIYSTIAFTIGSALCGIAWSNNSLIIFRVVQAIGGGMLIPLSMSIIYRIIPRQKIGMAMGVWGISATMAPAIGPTLGGYLVDHFSWHLIFTINIPIGIISVLLSYMFIEETEFQKDLKFDFLGTVISSIALVCLLLALSQGQDKGWTSQYIVTLFAISGFSIVIFCLWELSIPDPMLELRLFSNSTFTASILAVSLSSVAMFSAIFLIPMYCQTLRDLSPIQTGLLIMPMALATGMMMPVSGRLFDKIGALPLGIAGISIAAFFTFILSRLTLETDFEWIKWILVCRAIGLSLCLMPLSTAGMNTIPGPLVGRASALNNLARQISSSLGIAFMTYIMVHRQSYHAAWLSDGVTVTSPAAIDFYNQVSGIAASTLGPGTGNLVFQGYLGIMVQKQAMAQGIGDALLVSSIITLLIIPLVFYLSKDRVEASRQKEKEKYARFIEEEKSKSAEEEVSPSQPVFE